MDIDSLPEDHVIPLPQSNYYTIEEFNSNFKPFTVHNDNNYCNFSLLHMNVRSLQKNFENFDHFLSTLNRFSFSLIGISETWLNSTSPPLFSIDNYELLRADRKEGRGGGVAFYIHNDLNYKIRHDIHITGVENLFIEIIDEKYKNKIIGVVYRPPNNVMDTFFNELEACLEIISRENKDVYLMGDFNVDLSSPYNNSAQRIINIMSSFALHPLINKPTRITNSTQTIIDNIFSNVLNDISTGIMYYDISDHLPIFMINKKNNHLFKNPSKDFVMRRKETEQNIASLKIDLSQEDWRNVYSELDVNKSYESFIEKFLYYYNKNIPLHRSQFNKKKNKHPWITRGIIRSISTRNRLYKLSLRHPSLDNRQKYK